MLVGSRCFSQDGLNPFAQYVEECGGVDSLEELQSNQSIPDEIYDKAQKLICDFFNGEEIIGPNDGNMPFVNQQQQQNGNNSFNNGFGGNQPPPPQQQNGNGNMFGFGMGNQNNSNQNNQGAPTFNF